MSNETLSTSNRSQITTLGSAPDCGQLWAGHLSGIITVHTYTIGATGKIEFSLAPASVLLAHRNRVAVITLSRAFSIVCSGDSNGVLIIWDLNRYTCEARVEIRSESHTYSVHVYFLT